MSPTYTYGCGTVFEDEEKTQLCVESDPNLELEAFECRCGQVVDDPETVDICTNERHLF